jgi:hypothetical protein
MSNADLAKEIVGLLKKYNFPNAYTADEIHQQAHAIVYALITQVLSGVGSHFSLASQGTHGGVGPHRWDKLVQFSLSGEPKTLQGSEGNYRSVF